MALLGLTASTQAVQSFNNQISVSAQEERAAFLAQTSTSIDEDLMQDLYDGTMQAEALLHALEGSCEDGDHYGAIYGLEYLNYGLDFICENVSCDAFEGYLDDDQMYHLCEVVDDACEWGYELDSWLEWLHDGGDWNTDDCHYYLDPFWQLEDDVMEALCWYFPCDFEEHDEMLYNIAWGASIADDLYNAALDACYDYNADVALVALWYIDYGMDYLCDNVTDDLIQSLDIYDWQAEHLEETVYTACYLGWIIDYAAEHIEEHGADWDADNCQDYLAPLGLVIDNVNEAVCWFLDCEHHNAYLMLENLYWGMQYAEEIIDGAYDACESGDISDALYHLHVLNFGMDYICHNVTWDSMEIFLDDLTWDQIQHIYNSVVTACDLGHELDFVIEYVEEYGIPADIDCADELEIFHELADDILEALSWHFD
jgi:hypothetical protein